MMISSLLFPSVTIVQRYLRQTDGVFTILFFMALINTLTLWSILILKEKRKAFKTSLFKVHLFRALFRSIGGITTVYAIKYVQADLATTIFMSYPLWTALLAKFWVKENVEWTIWLSCFLGFLGVIIVSYSKNSILNIWCLLILISALTTALISVVMTKYSKFDESLWKWSAYNEIGILLPTFFLWIIFDNYELPLGRFNFYLVFPFILVPAIFAISYAFLKGKSSLIAPLGYLQIPASALLGILFLNEFPELNTYIGGILIISAGFISIKYSK